MRPWPGGQQTLATHSEFRNPEPRERVDKKERLHPHTKRSFNAPPVCLQLAARRPLPGRQHARRMAVNAALSHNHTDDKCWTVEQPWSGGLYARRGATPTTQTVNAGQWSSACHTGSKPLSGSKSSPHSNSLSSHISSASDTEPERRAPALPQVSADAPPTLLSPFTPSVPSSRISHTPPGHIRNRPRDAPCTLSARFRKQGCTDGIKGFRRWEKRRRFRGVSGGFCIKNVLVTFGTPDFEISAYLCTLRGFSEKLLPR